MSGYKSVLWGAVLGLAACSEPQATPRIVVIAGGAGMTAARLAAADMNTGDPKDSIEIFIVARGFETSADFALNIAGEVAAEPRTLAVVGHNNSAASLAAAQIYNQEHVVQIAPTSTAPAYSAVGPYSFRMVPDDRHQARTLAEIAQRESPNRRIAIGYVNDDYGRGLLHELQPLLAQAGTTVVSASPHVEPGDPLLFQRFIADLQSTRPDLLLWLGRTPPLAMLVAAGAVPPIVASDGLELGMLAVKDLQRFRGVRYTRFVDPRGDDPALRAFAARYEKASGTAVNSEAVYTYDAIMLLAKLIREGADTREKLQARTAAVGNSSPPFRGIGGEIAFDKNGDVMRPYLLALVTDSGIIAAPAR